MSPEGEIAAAQALRGTCCVVTGGLGFIGRRLVAELSGFASEVRVIDLAADEISLPIGFPLIRADIRDATAMERAFRGASHVFHLAGNASTAVSIRTPTLDFSVNALGTASVLDACVSAGVRRLVVASSASVYGAASAVPIPEEASLSPIFPYGASKVAAEVYARTIGRTFGFEVVVARPFCVYGPGESAASALVEVTRYLRWHLNDRVVPVIGDSRKKTRDFVHVDDAVEAFLILAASGTPGQAYNVGSGVETSIAALMAVIAETSGRTVGYAEDLSVQLDTFRLVADITKLRQLGYAPRVDLRTGVREVAEALGRTPTLPGCDAMLAPEHAGEAFDMSGRDLTRVHPWGGEPAPPGEQSSPQVARTT